VSGDNMGLGVLRTKIKNMSMLWDVLIV